ncbi:MAG: hypothetical protein HOK72_04825 [Flavobacteriales bacterium]|jgi:excinuclease UvrABC helicase subunit UvrB|nr:hypothetical protein [Flavobacteriales bacterium]
MDKRLIFELGKIEHYKKFVAKLLNGYSSTNPKGLYLSQKEFFELKAMLDRMFDNEVDFLIRNPEDYFEIYCDDCELPSKTDNSSADEPSEMDKLKQKLKKLRTEKEKHLELENYETAAQIRDKEREIMKKINTFSGK